MNDAPDKIVRELRENPDAYREAGAKEGEVWGKTFSSPEFKRIAAEDQEAARTLQPMRGLALPGLARQRGLTFESGLSLACGNGRAERDLVQQKICARFHGIDISERAIAEAEAQAGDLPLTYEVADLNHVRLAVASYDLVVTTNCLHHVLELEHLAEEIWHSLRPGGYLWVHDYIGETQFQYSDERLVLLNRILAILPERYRIHHLRNRRVIDTITRPQPGKLVSPFEAIRSAEIVAVFSQWFDIDYRHEQNALMHLLCPPGLRSNYLETEDGPAIFELLMLLDATLVEHGILTPHTGMYLMRRKAGLSRSAT